MKKRDKKERFNLPDAISISRFFFGIIVLYFILKNKIMIAGIFYFIGAFTDFLDGQVARKYNKITKLGGTLDALADRFLVIITITGLLIIGQLNQLMKIVFLVWLVGEAVLAVATAIKTHKFWIISVHRNSIRLTAFFTFIGLGWAMFNWPYLNIIFAMILFMLIITTIDYLFWFANKKWKTYESIEKKLKSSIFSKLMN